MERKCQNIYQSSRNIAGYTQERAAELLDTSIDSLRDYESGARRPKNKLVAKMAVIYGDMHLPYWHLSDDELGRTCLPDVPDKDLPSAVLTLQAALDDLEAERPRIVKIVCDGVISEDEATYWTYITTTLDAVMSAILAVKCAGRS